VKLSPTQNMTLLVRSRHPVREYRPIAAQLLSAGHVHAEQVGFVRTPTSPAAQVRLHMAGDEFCGNACMALAALTAAEQGLCVDDRTDVVLEASGADGLVTCRVERQDSDYYCRLAMPLPIRVEPCPVPDLAMGRSALVRYPDSLHLVIESDRLDQETRGRAEAVATRLGETAGVPLVGVMLYDPDRRELTPLVNVPALSSIVWERSCGSGTGALGAYLATMSGGPVRTSARQPGGTMHVEADHGAGGVTGLRIGGRVAIVAEGTAYVRA
jgi:histidine racemase